MRFRSQTSVNNNGGIVRRAEPAVKRDSQFGARKKIDSTRRQAYLSGLQQRLPVRGRDECKRPRGV
jgi:hypothetical protein